MSHSHASNDPSMLKDLKFWFVTHGVGAQEGWESPLEHALVQAGATVEAFGILSALARSSVDVIGANASKVVKTLRSLRSGTEEDADSLLNHRRPDVVLVDSPAQLQTLQRVRSLASPRPLVVGLVANFESTAEWMGQPVDALIAPTEEQLYDLRLVGTPDVAWQIAGPPIPVPWDQTFDRKATRDALKVDDETKVVLVDVSTMPDVLIDRVVHQLGQVQGNVSILYWYGPNDHAAATLRTSSASRRVPARMFGGAASPARAAAGADLVVVGDGAMNLAGYIAFGLPVLSVTTEALTHVLAQRGALVPLPGPEGLGAVVRQIVENGIAPSHAEAVARVKEQMSTSAVVDALRRIVSGRAELDAFTAKQSGPQMTLGLPIEEIGKVEPVPAVQVKPAANGRPATLSRAAAREELARIIIEERRIERDLKAVVEERDRWMQRASDAREENAEDLETWANKQVESALARANDLQSKLSQLQAEKEALKDRVGSAPSASTYKPDTSSSNGANPADMERRFKEMETRRMLRELRNKNRKND